MLPVLKWVGGKRQMLSHIKELMPYHFNAYYEPFVGAGAVFFEFAPNVAYINDVNKDLISVYISLQDNEQFNKLLLKLDHHEMNHSEDYYYEVRHMDRLEGYNALEPYEKAARVIYLNKAGFNGLYRVNQKGFYNVPSGKRKKVKLYDLDNLTSIHYYLRSNDIHISNLDFEAVVKAAKKDDFVYFDPPYDPWEDKNSFTSYAKGDFNKEDQIRLFETFKTLDKRGVKVMLSNHNTDFIRNLYKDYQIHVVPAKRVVNSNPNGRGNVEEVIIINYE